MLISIPIEFLHQTNCIMVIAPMWTQEKGYGYVMTPLAREMLESECKPISDMMNEAVFYYQENSNANRVTTEKPDGASDNLRTNDSGESISPTTHDWQTNPSGD